jgi:hypothetical protein
MDRATMLPAVAAPAAVAPAIWLMVDSKFWICWLNGIRPT